MSLINLSSGTDPRLSLSFILAQGSNAASFQNSVNKEEKKLKEEEQKVKALMLKGDYLLVLKLCSSYDDALSQRFINYSRAAENALIKHMHHLFKALSFRRVQKECVAYLKVCPNDRAVESLQAKAQYLIAIRAMSAAAKFSEVIEACDDYVSTFSGEAKVEMYKRNARYYQERLIRAEQAFEQKKYFLVNEEIEDFLNRYPTHEGAIEIYGKSKMGIEKTLADIIERLSFIPEFENDPTFKIYYSLFLEALACANQGNFKKAALLVREVIQQKKYRNENDRSQFESFLFRLIEIDEKRVLSETSFLELKFEESKSLFTEVLSKTFDLKMPMPNISIIPAVQPSMKLEEAQVLILKSNYESVIEEYLRLKPKSSSTKHVTQLADLLKVGMLRDMSQKLKEGHFDFVISRANQFIKLFPDNTSIAPSIRQIALFYQYKHSIGQQAVENEAWFLALRFSKELIDSYQHLPISNTLLQFEQRSLALQGATKIAIRSLSKSERIFRKIGVAYFDGNFQRAMHLVKKFQKIELDKTSESLAEKINTRLFIILRENKSIDSIEEALTAGNFELAKSNYEKFTENFYTELRKSMKFSK